MAQKKYRPGMNCEKSGKYACYNSKGTLVNDDVDMEKDRRFPPAQEEGCYYQEQQFLKHHSLSIRHLIGCERIEIGCMILESYNLFYTFGNPI